MRLKYQLFITLLLFSILLIALLAVLNSWSFNRGFTNYVVDIERQRLHSVGTQVASVYERNNNWDWIQDNPDALRTLLANELQDLRQRGLNIPGADQARGRVRQKFLLVDANRQLLLGRGIPEKNIHWEPIKLRNETIAYFGIREPRGLPGELAEVFIGRQLKNYVYAAIATVVLSALLAILLASRIVKPILSVNSAVRHIIGGDYKHRIRSNRRDELGDVARNINQMAHTLESNQSARQQWMAEISHELRTPVAVLQGELEAIQDGVSSFDEAAIDSLHAESIRLGLLIDDLHELTLSDVGALNYQMQAVELAEILEQRLNLAKATLAQAQLTVNTHVTGAVITVNGDAQRLAQLIDNLLQNSVRYTNAGGRIDIELRYSGDKLTLLWSDSTPGVTEEQLPHLFNLLYRTEESRSREFGGSGLGLAIVKKIVLAHQGSIRALHSESGGLSIEVQLPG